MGRTYIVEIDRQGHTQRLEVWATSVHEARRIVTARYPDAFIADISLRKAF